MNLNEEYEKRDKTLKQELKGDLLIVVTILAVCGFVLWVFGVI